jgi:hypothetical protein
VRIIRGDIWDRFKKSFVVIPTNIGFTGTPEKPGPNVMSRGVAAHASSLVPGLAQLYGELCARYRENTAVTFDISTGIVYFPTKPFNPDSPHLSWKTRSSLELIDKSARQLAAMTWMTRATVQKHTTNPPPLEDDDVYLPLVGCGNGELPEEHVIPILENHLKSDRFILVDYIPF